MFGFGKRNKSPKLYDVDNYKFSTGWSIKGNQLLCGYGYHDKSMPNGEVLLSIMFSLYKEGNETVHSLTANLYGDFDFGKGVNRSYFQYAGDVEQAADIILIEKLERNQGYFIDISCGNSDVAERLGGTFSSQDALFLNIFADKELVCSFLIGSLDQFLANYSKLSTKVIYGFDL
jgi:hypothetical protein